MERTWTARNLDGRKEGKERKEMWAPPQTHGHMRSLPWPTPAHNASCAMREVSSVVRLRRHHVIRNGHAHHDASDNTPSDTSKGAHAGRVGRRTYGKESAVHVSTGHVTTYRKSPDGGSKCPVWRPARRLSKVGGRAVQGKNLDGKELGRKNEMEGKERNVGTPPNPRTHAVAALADTCA